MSNNEEDKNYQLYNNHEERIKNAEPRYLTEGKKHYLLASSQESLQALQENQKAELTRVLISLKSEHDQLTLETNKIRNMLDEYDKRIAMLQSADQASKEAEEKQKKDFEFMDNGIASKKDRKNEEEFTKKSLLKQKEKLNKDILIIQKEIIKYENESQNLDKKMERAAINENIIKEKKNKVYSKTENQRDKNETNQSENNLKLEQYRKMIDIKSKFLKFSDERKETQNQIAEKAKNDSLDKQEVEKRKTLKLLMLYNQYLRTLMDEELKENENLEGIFEQIRDICGTKDLNEIVDFILLRNKRYNYACQEINECEQKNKKLKKEINYLKTELTNLKNKLLVEEKGDGNEIDVEISTNPEEENEIIEKEKEKNKNLLLLGKKYNEVEEAYQLIIKNITSMIENEKENPLFIDEEYIKNREENRKKEEEEKKKKEEEERLKKEQEEDELYKDKTQEEQEERQKKLQHEKEERELKEQKENEQKAKKEEEETQKKEKMNKEKKENEEIIEKLQLTNDELKKFEEIEYERKERGELDKYELTDEEKRIVKRARLTDKDIEEIKKNELNVLDMIIRKDENDVNLTGEQREIIEEIIQITLTEDEKKNAKEIKLTEEEEKKALQTLKNEKTEETKEKKIENFKELKLKYKKYKKEEKKEITKYKILKYKKNKIDLIKNYNSLLNKYALSFDSLEIMENKKVFINHMNQKGKEEEEANNIAMRNKLRAVTKRGTRKVTKRLPTNRRYLKTDNYKIVEDKDEEDDKSNYDPDVKILNKFLKEQKKEKENFVSGKTKIPDEKK